MVRVETATGIHDVDANVKDVREEGGSLIVRRDNTVVGKYRRWVAYWEVPQGN